MLFENFLQDVRLGLRVSYRESGYCALAVVVLALGIGGVTTMFSVVNGTMLRGFSFPNAARMVGVQFVDVTQKATLANSFTPHIHPLDYEAIRTTQKSFDFLAAYTPGASVNIVVDGAPQRLSGAYVTDEFFKVLGVGPVLGRDFNAADNRPGVAPVVLLSHQHWQRDFGGSPNVLGKSIRLNGKPATIIGVMPPGFAFPLNEEIWIPYYTEYPLKPRDDRNAKGVAPGVVGVLKAGVTLEHAGAEMTGCAQQLAAAFPATNRRFDTALVQPMLKDFFPPGIAELLWTMLAFCAGILLIACFNVMNMQFARATLRAQELAIRSALGATRGRLVRQMLTESLLTAALGAVGGIVLAQWAIDYLSAAAHATVSALPAFMTFDLDGRVLALVLVAAGVAAALAGFVPAWLASRPDAAAAMKEGSRGTTSRGVAVLTRGLVVLQVVVTCVLLIGSLLQAEAVLRQQRVDYGYDTAAVLSARMALMDADYPTPAARKLFLDRLVLRLRASPDFEGAALTNRRQMITAGTAKIEIEGRAYRTDDSDRPAVNVEQITDGYFAVLGVRLREGRDFASDDTDAKLPVAIVNAAFAKKYFSSAGALGRRFRTVANNGTLFGPWRTIVGVAETTRMRSPFSPPDVDDAGFYLPYYSTVSGPAQAEPATQQFPTVVVRPRGAGRAQAVAPVLQHELNQVDPNLPLYAIGTPKENLAAVLAPFRLVGVMFAVFGGVAIVLASVGLYGVMSFSVNQRMAEFGIRMALGADRRLILRLVLRQAGVQLALGIALGLAFAVAISIAAASALAGPLFHANPLAPATYAAVAALVTGVGLFAALIPAVRATRVSPMGALRAD